MNFSQTMVQETISFFLFTMAELTVLFIGISFLVGVLNEFLPQERVQKYLSGRGGRGYIIGAILGSLTPFCSCSTIPFTVGLLRAGAGFGPTMAFLFTSPLVNPIIIPLFLTLLGFKVTVVYGAVAIVLAITIGFFLEKAGFSRFVRSEMVVSGTQDNTGDRGVTHEKRCCAIESGLQPNVSLQSSNPSITSNPAGVDTKQQGPVSSMVLPMAPGVVVKQPNRWRRILQESVSQFRRLIVFIVLGVAIGAVIHGFLPADFVVALAGAENPLAIPVSALVGIPLYLRASTMVPIAASLIAKGMSHGAVVALIIGGAGASLPEVAMLKGIFRMQLLAAFIAAVMVMAISAGFLVNMVVW